MSYKITIIAGARPNFVKIAPIIHELEQVKSEGATINYRLVHTGQHYDKNMSGSFFNQLKIPQPHVNLNCYGGSHATQTASIMVEFEKELLSNPANLVLVVGDVTSTMACAIVAQKLHTKVAHIEAGIRSDDWSMPEEINRLITDSITNYFFTTSETANKNLINNGISKDYIFFVGNTMIDSLLKHRPHFFAPPIWNKLNLIADNYMVLTLHRPANVDEENRLKFTIDSILAHSNNIPIIFPVHPRTKKVLERLEISYPKLYCIDPLSYLEFNYLVENAKAVLTDSGGITEEASIQDIPCMTLRDNTERPETITLGTNVLVGMDPIKIKPHLARLFKGQWKRGQQIPKWDGKASKRIVDVFLELQKSEDL
ncbi:non-hydrolyzing UDP-N-acetylglucosamine 2-epimerase [Winogradskyella vincentii]|uniref:UDP-N-acetylglucosamine 2-epimerase (Non-hydrolyzing) n=1 Tax=Winogradskyella vincentii TaxID=2877122 RepID=A0ABS7XW49_9FLAO|nr:UDP-N-acetylglucosamine 2-epimerase (non-hydrolyzing) [Winogradskyella vincentii]MCA0151867.1 UDP-N-acetylglucosamine 2-epimerase (non-hydrolyzing) [Winogradskyella vincentii]